jgi:hypothetical protein
MARRTVQFGHQQQSAIHEMLVGIFRQVESVEVEDVGVVDGLGLEWVGGERRGKKEMPNDQEPMTKE